jgi:large repetitive protein
MLRAVVRSFTMPPGSRRLEHCPNAARGWRRARLLAPVALVLCLLVSAAPAIADRAFTPRFSTNDTGNITFAANTLLTCPAGVANCANAQQTGGVASGTNNLLNNNNYTMGYVNTAPGTVAGSPTFDSSSATLSLPSTATVLFAGLYWGGDVSAGVNGGAAHSPALAGQVGFEAPGASAYSTLNAAPADLNFSTLAGQTNRYGGFVDVTSQVRAAGAGSYSVANVQGGTGQDRYAGWTLVVAYRDSGQPPRNLTVFDGFASINSGSPPVSIPVSGFKTPPAGAVRTTVGFVAYEGDAGLTGDSASLDGTTLSDAVNPPNNFFNSAISNLGTNVTTKSPNFVNQLGFDAKLVAANGVLPNSSTAATVRITTSSDAYFDQVISFATDLYAPNITSSKSVTNVTHPGGPDQHGDVLRYTVSYTNTGADSATNFVMHDPIPSGSTYVPGSLRITAGPQAPASPTDALGDDSGEFNSGAGEVVFRLGAGGNATTGGTIAPNETDTVTFEVKINAGDAAGQQIVNQATATFVGQTLGTPFIDTSPQVTNTVAVPDLRILKSHTGSFVGGVATTFTLAVSNVGTAPTDGSTVTVSDPFPPSSFSAIATAGGSGWSCATAALTLTCTRSDVLAAGTSYPPILVDATVQDPPPATVSNTVTVSGGGSASSSASDGGGASGLADVSITKRAQPGTVVSGDQVTYTLNVQNLGPSSAQNVIVSDPLATGSYRGVSVQSSQGSCDATVSCSLGTLAAHSTATITITATVIAHDTTLTNTASASSSTPDPNTGNNSASASVTVPPSADLTIAKTGTVNPTPGPDSFTLTVSNNGPDSASGVVVNDSLPSQFTATGASGGGFTCTLPGGPGGTLVCTRASLAVADGSQQIIVTGTLATGTEGQMPANVATVSSNTSDPDLSNNTATFTQLVVPSADVGITKLALRSGNTTPLTTPVPPGGTFDYQLTVTNSGPSPAVGVAVSDTLPTDITLLATAPGCAPGAGSGGTITCTIGTLASGATQVITLHVIVSASAPGAAPTNTATVSSTTPDPNSSNNSSSATVGITPVADLALAKSVSPQTASVGDVVTYTFVVTNNGPEGTGGLVSEDLPAGLQFVSGLSCADDPGPPETVSCNVGALAPDASATASFTARVTTAAAGTQVQNQANVTSIAAGGAFPQLDDPSPSNNTSSASLTVNPQADVSLAKTVSNPNPGTDDEVLYTLTASNAGPNDATGVKITDSLPAGLDFLDASPGCDNGNGTVTCDVGTIANGGHASVTIRALTTPAVAGTSVTNGATASANEQDPNPNNNQATAAINIKPLVDLKLTKVTSNPAPKAGGSVTFTLSLVNNGPNTATGVVISDPLPSGLSFLSATPGQGSCKSSGQTVTCDLGALGAGGATVVTITAKVAASTAGHTLKNIATASANEQVARPETLTSPASITPVTGPPATTADLSLTKKVNHANGRAGQALTYTITVTNHGPAISQSPTVTDVFSARVTVLSVHTTSGSCKHSQTITCTLASIASGASDTITIVAKPTSIGELRNTASVASPTPDPDPTNNVSHVTTKVRPGPAALRLTKTASRRTVAPGQPFSFTIAVHSLGPEPALGVQVCDRLGSGMAFISVDHASFRHGSACWKIESLAKGKVRRYVVKVRALAVATGARRLTNVATASADGVRRQTARASVKVAPPPRVPAPVTG